MTQKTSWCKICEEEEAVFEPGICKNCYQYMYRWKGKSVKKIMQRQTRIATWQKRLEILGGQRGSNR